MFDSYGPAADPYMTVVGYFNATRELAGMRRYLDDDVTTRVRSHGRPRGLADRIASSAGMLAIEELTSRISSAEISNVLKRLEAGFSADLDTSVRRRAILAETADALKNKRDGQSVADVSRPGPGADDAKDQLAEFSRRCSGVRLVYDAWTSRVTEVAVRDPQTWTWQVIPVGTPAERQFRQIALSLLTAAVAPVTSQVVGPPSSLDNALGALAPVLSPAVILAKLCNVAVQAAAHHIMPGPFAPVLGAAAEKTVTQWAVSVSPLGKVSDAAQNIDVVLDVANDQFTPNVRDLALDKVADRIMEKRLVISPAELRKLIAEDSGDLKPPFQRPGPADPGRWDGPRWPGGI